MTASAETGKAHPRKPRIPRQPNDMPIRVVLEHSSWLQRYGIKIFELAIPLAAIGIALWTNIRSNELQEQLAKSQLRVAIATQTIQHRSDLIASLGSNISKIDLRTPSGRASYALCLGAAISLDKGNVGRFQYRSILPKYDEDHLEEYLSNDPVLLHNAIEYGPKPADSSDANSYYVIVAIFEKPNSQQLDVARRNMHMLLDNDPATSDLSVSILQRKADPSGVAMVIGSRMSATEAGILQANIKRVIPNQQVEIILSSSLIRGKSK
jgi:hypothetical protein